MTTSREYITLRANSDRAANQELIWRLMDEQKPLIDGKQVGFLALAFHSAEDIENEDRDVAKILAASGGRLPVILVNVTFEPKELSAGQLADWERRFGCAYWAKR